MNTNLDLNLTFPVSADDRDGLEDGLWATIEELGRIADADSRVVDPDMEADLVRGLVTFHLRVTGFDLGDENGPSDEGFTSALNYALSTIRAAIHAAEGRTPRWSKVHLRFGQLMSMTQGEFADA